jgi:N-methylhydantoinase B
VTFRTAGGGGYGNPSQRDHSAVKRDLAFGYVSEIAAIENYSYDVHENS